MTHPLSRMPHEATCPRAARVSDRQALPACECERAELFKQWRRLSILAREMSLIEKLTREEASYVTIVSPNADFEGPNFVVEVSGHWTDYVERRYSGDTRAIALETAVSDYE